MNLEESNEFAKSQSSKNKKRNIILGMLIICAIAIILLILIIRVLKATDANTAKLYINRNKINLSRTLFVSQDEVTYVSVKELANLTGYNYIQGEYKTFAKDNNYCYLKSDYEVISFNVDNNKVKKYLLNVKSGDEENTSSPVATTPAVGEKPIFVVKSENDSMEIFELSTNVISINDNIYMPVENIEKIFNISIAVDGKSTYIYDIYYLYQIAVNMITQSCYQAVSTTFENIRALPDNMIIAQNTSGKYGVISIDGKKVLDFIYTDIQYIQNTEEFFVYTDDNTVGLLDKEGNKIIAPTEYDTLTVFDEVNKLYLAENDGKFGILQVSKKDQGEPVKKIVTVAFDKIGLRAIELFDEYKLEETESPNLLEEKYIVVLEDGKFGLYDLEGDRMIKSIYDSFGFIPSEEDKKNDFNSVLIIPKEYGIYGLIIEQNGLYGIFDLESSEIVIPCSLSKIYSKTESGDFGYYMETGDEVWDIKEYFADYDNGTEEETEKETEEEIPEEFEEIVEEENTEEVIDENEEEEQPIEEQVDEEFVEEEISSEENEEEIVEEDSEENEEIIEEDSEENEEIIEEDSEENEFSATEE